MYLLPILSPTDIALDTPSNEPFLTLKQTPGAQQRPRPIAAGARRAHSPRAHESAQTRNHHHHHYSSNTLPEAAHKMPSDLSSYLATRYLTADPKPSSSTKKRKKKQPGADAGLIIADEDEDAGWRRAHAAGDDDEEGPATVAGTSAEFRKTKRSAWKTVGAPVPAATQGGGADDAAADAILRSAAQESAAAGGAGQDGDDAAPVITMSDGTHAGLQTAAAVSAQLERRKRKEREDYERQHPNAAEAETVYRDATGRRVDISMKRAEARREAAEAEAKKAAALEALKGEVQREEARKRREELEDVRVKGVARRADDEDMNAELKAQSRWGDTMAEFVGQGGGGGSAVAGGKKKTKGRPVYQGAAPPNRYGIRPGYRWDGVDRSNGFEMERFKAINRVERNKTLDYNWQMDE